MARAELGPGMGAGGGCRVWEEPDARRGGGRGELGWAPGPILSVPRHPPPPRSPAAHTADITRDIASTADIPQISRNIRVFCEIQVPFSGRAVACPSHVGTQSGRGPSGPGRFPEQPPHGPAGVRAPAPCRGSADPPSVTWAPAGASVGWAGRAPPWRPPHCPPPPRSPALPRGIHVSRGPSPQPPTPRGPSTCSFRCVSSGISSP